MIEFRSKSLFYSKLVRSKAKMIEFDIPLESHIPISKDAKKSFPFLYTLSCKSVKVFVETSVFNKI